MPKERLHKPGGLYDIKINDGYEVLEIVKGGWVEAIFAKVKPAAIKPKLTMDDGVGDGKYDDEDDVDIKDDYYSSDDDDDVLDDDTMTEESYRTTVEEDPDALSLDATDITEGDDDY